MKTTCFIQGKIIRSHSNRTADRALPRTSWISRVKLPGLLLAASLALAATSVRASDPVGVFARIDRVVLEPNEASPERVQLWGAFCVADSKDRDSYLPPQKGFLYYKLPGEKPEVARKEWNDLKSVAGSGDVIGFASRFGAQPKVRDAKDKPENPDTYSVGFGLVKARQRGASYPPVKALQTGVDKKASEPKEKRQ